jgi:3'-phosphoadenosine 5'-phosphosulfate sulfotransferase (PAPS reductase)/FAD synthetase
MQNDKLTQGTLFDNPPVDEPLQLLPLDQYDVIAVCYSGGKDSLACLIHLLDLGVPPSKIELHHQGIDGQGEALMDWPCTHAYVQATADALGIPVVFSWRDGGFVREMLREQEPTAGVSYEREGTRISLPTIRASLGTRRKFPQTSADLSVRWCSAALKIDPFARVLNNEPAYQGKKILVVTGERREESSARAKYDETEEHRCNSRNHLVHQWRPVIDWTEQQVWDIIAKHRVRAHPAYALGWGRVSCLACIFGDDDQWASVKGIAPERFERIGDLEREFGTTIKRGQTVEEMARRGKEFVSDKPEELRRLAMSPDAFTSDPFFLAKGETWTSPAGAYKRCGGPL